MRRPEVDETDEVVSTIKVCVLCSVHPPSPTPGTDDLESRTYIRIAQIVNRPPKAEREEPPSRQ